MLGVVSECCDSMNIEYSFLWGFFIMFGTFLVCICVVLICCCLRKSEGQGDNFEQNRVLEHQNNCQYALKILLILHRDESLKNSPGYQAATVS